MRFSTRLREKFSVIPVTPWIGAFGNCAEDIYYGLLRARREGKRILLLSYREIPWKFRLTVSNRELLKLKSPFAADNTHPLFAALEWFLTASYTVSQHLYQLWRKLRSRKASAPPFNPRYILPTVGRSRLWRPKGVASFHWRHCDVDRWKQEYTEPLPLAIDPKKRQRAEVVRMREMGIPLDDWFVCLHVREAGYRNEPRYNFLRNASVANYLDGIRCITERGGWVVRLGDPSMTPLPPMERVIDYARSPFKGQLMDLYLLSECRFFLGTNSGPQEVARLFQRPELLVNVCEWLYSWPVRAGDRMITKHLFSTSWNRFLSVREMFEAPLDCQFYFHAGAGTYALHENTAEEIRDAIREFLDISGTAAHSPLQLTAREAQRRQIRRWLDEDRVITGRPSHAVEEAYRVASKLAFHGAMAHSFLERNWLKSSRPDSPS